MGAGEMKNYNIGDIVVVLQGLLKWQSEHGLYDKQFSDIEGKTGIVKSDYTALGGINSHYEIDLGGFYPYYYGIHPDFLISLENYEHNKLPEGERR
jgi:hypothetical protein